MSAHVQPLAHPGGGGAVVLTFTVSKVTVLKALELCEVTAKPASTEPLMLNVALEPNHNFATTLSGSTFSFSDPGAINQPGRFYRAIWLNP